MRYEWEEIHADGSVENWDIELREYQEPKFHLFEEGAADKHHPKIKCPVCGVRLFDVETPEDKNEIKIVNLDWDKGGDYYHWAEIKFHCHRCSALLGLQTHNTSALQLYLPKVGLLLA